MNKFSLKLDVSLSKLAFAIVGSVVCYEISRCISNLISSDTLDDDKDVSKHYLNEYPPNDCPPESINKNVVPGKSFEKCEETVLENLKDPRKTSEPDTEQLSEDEIENSHNGFGISEEKENVHDKFNISEENMLNEASLEKNESSDKSSDTVNHEIESLNEKLNVLAKGERLHEISDNLEENDKTEGTSINQISQNDSGNSTCLLADNDSSDLLSSK